MRVGVQVREPFVERPAVLEALAESARMVRAAGLDSFWLVQAFEWDALTALAVVGPQVQGLELGTAVVPTFPRHPLVLATQAQTVRAAVGDRVVLGIGPSHRQAIESIYGQRFSGLGRHMEEYLRILRPALAGEQVDVDGAVWRAHPPVPLEVAGGGPCSVVLGAMGPVMLRLAGELADGTVTSKAGPRALATHIVPAVTAAAASAGRPVPRVAACLPVCLTSRPDRARELAQVKFGHSEDYASYRAMLDLEGVRRVSEVAMVGDEAELDAQLARLASAGATDLLARVFGTPDEIGRTIEYLGAWRQGAPPGRGREDDGTRAA